VFGNPLVPPSPRLRRTGTERPAGVENPLLTERPTRKEGGVEEGGVERARWSVREDRGMGT